MANSDKLQQFAVDLFEINAIKFGDFQTKVGLMTPVYCDLRMIVSYPKLMSTLSELIISSMTPTLTSFDILCGVPYTALPIATAISLQTNIPMVMRRKEAKAYGTKKMIEGNYKCNDKCLIVEDVVTSGGSVLETVADLVKEGISCTHAVVLLNREQGGEAILRDNGITMIALLTLTQLMGYLRQAGKVDEEMCGKVRKYLEETQLSKSAKIEQEVTLDRLTASYEARVPHARNPVAASLLRLMAAKRSNLCLAADLTDPTDLLNLVEEVGAHICLLKLHVNIIQDFHPNLIKALRQVAVKHRFMICEDAKYADIGNTVKEQYSGGMYKVSAWADVVTMHGVMGAGGLDAIRKSKGLEDRGVFLLAQASSDSLITPSYTTAVISLASHHPDLITGLVAQDPLCRDQPGLVQLTPGVKLPGPDNADNADELGQRYRSPEHVVKVLGADVAVVGRGVTEAGDPLEAVKEYKRALWAAYLQRIGQ